MLVHVELEELAVRTVGVTVRVVWIRMRRVVLFIRQKLLWTSLLELAHSRAGLLRESSGSLSGVPFCAEIDLPLGSKPAFWLESESRNDLTK